MRKFVNTVVIVPLALVMLAYALANRRFVTVSFNPFDPNDASLALTLPLYIVIIASAKQGEEAGGFASWSGQRRLRKAAGRVVAEAAQAGAELAEQRRIAAFRAPAPRPTVPP